MYLQFCVLIFTIGFLNVAHGFSANAAPRLDAGDVNRADDLAAAASDPAAAAELEKKYGPADRRVAERLVLEARVAAKAGQAETALKDFARAVSILEATTPPDPVAVAGVRLELAGFLDSSNRIAESEPIYRDVLVAMSPLQSQEKTAYKAFFRLKEVYATLKQKDKSAALDESYPALADLFRRRKKRRDPVNPADRP